MLSSRIILSKTGQVFCRPIKNSLANAATIYGISQRVSRIRT